MPGRKLFDETVSRGRSPCQPRRARRNIADAADRAGTGYPQLSSEYIVSASPDLIVLADSLCCGQKPSTVAARPGWGTIAAVRTGSIVRIDDSVASRWGPRLVDFFRALSQAVARLRA